MKVLITAGATREPIDDVRFLSNVSTGTTGASLADALSEAGHEVLLLRGAGAVSAGEKCQQETFMSAQDLLSRVQQHLATGDFTAVIMTAAVSDYRPKVAVSGKISSDNDQLTLQLVRNEKILPKLKAFSSRPLYVVGFKLTVGANEQLRRDAVAAQFAAGGVDAVVQNDLSEIRVATRESHPFRLFKNPADAPIEIPGAKSLAREVEVSIREAAPRVA
jgi:phosphopantothenoylcysteine decarboxylase/phosphopantothenate--cysteine ligase